MGRKSKRRMAQELVSAHGGKSSAPGADLEFVDDRPPRPASRLPIEARRLSVAAVAVEPEPRSLAAARSTVTIAEPAAVATLAATPPVASPAVERGAEAAAPGAPWPPSCSPAPPATGAAAAAAVEPEAVAEDPDPVGTLGELLAAAREARGLSIEAASGRTRISAKMLRHLENDRFGEFAAEAYARGFLRNYGLFLGLDPNMLLRRYEALFGKRAEPAPDVWDEVVAAPEQSRPSRRKHNRLLFGAVAAVAVGLGGWSLVRFAAERRSFELRPAAGLQQIENELRDANSESAPVPGATGVAASSANPAAAPQSASAAPAPAGAAEDTSPNQGVALASSAAQPPNPAAGTTVGASTPSRKQASAGVPVHAPAAKPASATLRTTGAEAASTAGTSIPAAASPPPGEVTDLVEISFPEQRADAATLVLTATALDTCVLRLQVDSDARRAQRYYFTRRGESRTWTARSSFRLLAKQAANLELRLNGKLLQPPQEGRTIVLDGSSLRPRPARDVPRRSSGRSTRRAPRAHTSAPASPASPQNAAGPPR